MKENHRNIAVVLALAGVMGLKTLFFPCDCSVQQPDPLLVGIDRSTESLVREGIVTMLDLGATECVPCKMMAPIIDELKKEYAGKAEIVFVDVWKEPEQSKKYGIRSIPTQIFFDQDGKEVYRHTGFMDKKSIIGILRNIGVS